ncbi:MAG TPA: glycosyltransferase family 39 protein, partial [Polyangiaceae bacterium]|nr:glycosyltransferase family 39 protein [Polyangiaceae bacterium]
SLFLYFNAAVEGCYFAVCRVFGRLHELSDLPELDIPIMGIGWTSLPSAFLTLRAVSLLFGIALVWLVYGIGRYLSHSADVGMLAALLVAISPNILENTRWVTPEGMLTFTVTAALFASLKAYEFGRARDYVLASVLAGLAASIKYNGALVGLSVCLAAIFRDRARVYRNPWFYAAPLIAITSFLLTTPYALLDQKHFLQGMMFERKHYATGHAGSDGDTLAFYCNYLLEGEGVVALLIIGGVVLSVVRFNPPTLIITIYCAVYFGFINTFVVRNGRTLVQIIPALLVLAAWFAREAFVWLSAQKLAQRLPSAVRVVFPILLLVGLIARPLRHSIRDTRALLWKDNRELAHDWVEANLAPRTRIAIGDYACYVSRSRYTLRPIKDVSKLSHRWLDQHADYVVLSSGAYTPYVSNPDRYPKEARAYKMVMTDFELVAHFNDPKGGDEIRVYRIRPAPTT